MKTKQSGFGVIELLLIIVTIGLIGALGWIAYDRYTDQVDEDQASSVNTEAEVQPDKEDTTEQKQEPEPVKPRTLAQGTFGNDGHYGTLQAEGYSTVVERGGDTYIFFTITRTENDTIFEYLKTGRGNAFMGDDAIGVGCLADGEISYVNGSSRGFVEYTISAKDTAAIMAATAKNPIALDIERFQPGPGMGAPACYSHFATFTVMK